MEPRRGLWTPGDRGGGGDHMLPYTVMTIYLLTICYHILSLQYVVTYRQNAVVVELSAETLSGLAP
jgi:hypothetical protein